MTLSRERMAEYQRARRAKGKVSPVCPSCELLKAEIEELKRHQFVKPERVISGRVAHSLNCSCMMCKPPKK
jgi:hypothetical protein